MPKLLFACSLAATLAASPLAAYALPATGPINGLSGGDHVGESEVRNTVYKVIVAFLGIIGIIAVIVIIIAGTRLILAGGNEEAARAARRQIIYAVIGLIVVLLSVVIVNFVIKAVPSN
ncbi:MAG: hypothetical protein COT71_02440 [Candidatus Andersenbacteria bacterium CG10_big_fil_rev_8_21_14_0_10_54_11]|uniref:DUF4190 domain-containing protein n=1 Tax=Candidatus Andersenbacteria bacterium CG10_big_fil_rev_8_21_14_0_10_54_11 TaxID=1974485 RepID=A0A2M6WZ95_9BACT|nr:MAG: hypothetical protein COT71_02440 [Candidatus Andersenbacteria bacterium CG10_big_fil_rev_8_21_14_0_10_54_11]